LNCQIQNYFYLKFSYFIMHYNYVYLDIFGGFFCKNSMMTQNFIKLLMILENILK